LPVVLYGCQTRSLALKEEHRLKVFENRVLRRIFVPKRDEIIGGWRKLYHEELQKFRASPNINTVVKSRIMRWVGHVAYIGETRNAYRVLLGNNKERDH
jgi:hypothetical protein